VITVPLIAYERNTMRPETLAIVEQIAAICREYAAAGYPFTLRGLYYQLVGRGVTHGWPTGDNTTRTYKRIIDLVTKGRMAGLIDWDHIVDNERNLRGNSHWSSPGDIIDSAAWGYRRDKWIGQPRRVEVWVEKEALSNVIGRTASAADVDYFACKGYVSISEIWKAAHRLGGYFRVDQAVTILHLGDHDPSGIDMSRDIQDRLTTFLAGDMARTGRRSRMPWLSADDGAPWLEVRRIALTMEQVEQYDPPPNPAKLTDSRAESYIAEHGDESWELDALAPPVIDALISAEIDGIRDLRLFQEVADQEAAEREELTTAARRWPEVQTWLTDNPDVDEE
jgi:hypothetical protein